MGPMEPDAIPAVDGDDAARQLQAARAETVVVLSPNNMVRGVDAELAAMTMANGGVRTHVVGWRRARPEERVPGWQGAWQGEELDGHGEPWWWRQRPVVGVGDLAQHGRDFAAYEDRWAQAQAQADAGPRSAG